MMYARGRRQGDVIATVRGARPRLEKDGLCVHKSDLRHVQKKKGVD